MTCQETYNNYDSSGVAAVSPLADVGRHAFVVLWQQLVRDRHRGLLGALRDDLLGTRK